MIVTSHIQFAIFNKYSDNKEIILNLSNTISIGPIGDKDTDQLRIVFATGDFIDVVGRMKEIKKPLGIPEIKA